MGNRLTETPIIMDEQTLDKHLHELKFVVLAGTKTGKPIGIYFGFTLPGMHSEIFAEAEKEFRKKGIDVTANGGGRITKKDKYIIFHGRSEKYGRYEDNVVLKLAPEHPYFKDKGFTFLSKAGEDDFYKIIAAG